MAPVVSIITPFLNAEAFLGDAIASVRRQTLLDWELLLVDDGSTDGSLAIALAAADSDKRIRLIERSAESNRGAAAARNAGIAAARGNFVAFLDADDLFDADKLAEDVSLMRANPTAMMLYGPTRWWHPGEEHRDWVEDMSAQANRLHGPPKLLKEVLILQKGEVPCTCGVLIGRSAIVAVGGFHESFRLYEDQTLWVKLFLHYPVLVTNVARAVYRQHPASTSAAASSSGLYDRFGPHSSRKAFLEWIMQYLSCSAFHYPDVERALRRSLAAYPEHASRLRASDRAFEMSDRTAAIISRSVRPAIRRLKGGIRRVQRAKDIGMFSIRRRATSAFRLIRPKPVILMYHRIAKPATDPWGLAVSPACFDEQMTLLQASRSLMPLAELVDRHRRKVLPQDAVAVTFDDGYLDNLANAKPILDRHGAPATLFLATGTVGSRVEYWWDELARLILLNSEGIDVTVQIGSETVSLRIPSGGDAEAAGWRAWTGSKTQRQATYLEVWGKLRLLPMDEIQIVMATLRSQITSRLSDADLPMTAAQIKELLADGLVNLGGHTVSHPVLPSLSTDKQMFEIANGKAACEALSDRSVAGFAYPYGEFDERSARLARECGFQWACSTEAKGLGGSTIDFFSLPRIQVMDWDGKTFARELRNVV